MGQYDEQLRDIYDKTDGRCHLCGKKLSIKNYAAMGKRGAWEVEHSNPKSKGGTDHLNNLYPACISCNRQKSNVSTRTARAWNGRTKAPLSKIKREEVKVGNAFGGAVICGLVGLVAGPVGVILGASLGAVLGYGANPEN